MTEINRDLSLKGLNFQGSKSPKKTETKEANSFSAEEKSKINLDRAPGALYGRAEVKSSKLDEATQKCIRESVSSYKKHPDKYHLAETVYSGVLSAAIEDGMPPSDAMLLAHEIALGIVEEHSDLDGDDE